MFNRHQISNRLAALACLAVLALLMAVPTALAMPDGSGRSAPPTNAAPTAAKCATGVVVAAATAARVHRTQEVAPRFWLGHRLVTACGLRFAGR